MNILRSSYKVMALGCRGGQLGTETTGGSLETEGDCAAGNRRLAEPTGKLAIKLGLL